MVQCSSKITINLVFNAKVVSTLDTKNTIRFFYEFYESLNVIRNLRVGCFTLNCHFPTLFSFGGKEVVGKQACLCDTCIFPN